MSSEFTKREANVMIDSMEYHRVLSENKDSTIPKKDEATLPSDVIGHSLEAMTKQASPDLSRKKLG